jgi:hypothetical protein
MFLGLVRLLRKRIAGYVTKGTKRARSLRQAIRLVGEPSRKMVEAIWHTLQGHYPEGTADARTAC